MAATAGGPRPAAHTATPAGPGTEPPEPGRPLRRDAEVNRQHILDAAGRLMAERGLSTPLEDIAAAAGVGIATLYRRFPTRAELIEALFKDRMAAYLADLEAAAAGSDGWEALLWFLRRSSARQIADRALNELLEHDPRTDTIRQLRERVRPLAQLLVERAQATGRLRPDFTVSDLAFLQQMLVAVGVATDPLRPTVWHRYLDLLADSLAPARDRTTPLGRPALTIDEMEALYANRPAARR